MRIGNFELDYFSHHYNNPSINERRIEVPIALKFLELVNNDCIEIGCVVPYYTDSKHKVIDLYDEHAKAENIDALTFDYSNQNCLSISTIEHFGEIYNDPQNIGKYFDKDLGFKGLMTIIGKANKYLVSFPLGLNRNLEESVKNSELPFLILKRDAGNNWSIDESKSFNYEYASPFHFANAICIITNVEDFYS
jgi:hypothetical protein